jgi:hypothetical protein
MQSRPTGERLFSGVDDEPPSQLADQRLGVRHTLAGVARESQKQGFTQGALGNVRERRLIHPRETGGGWWVTKEHPIEQARERPGVSLHSDRAKRLLLGW